MQMYRMLILRKEWPRNMYPESCSVEWHVWWMELKRMSLLMWKRTWSTCCAANHNLLKNILATFNLDHMFTLDKIILVAATTTTAMLVGLFYGWSVSVIPGIAKLNNTEYL